MADQKHETSEAASQLVPDGPEAVERAHALHHLATADPEPERDGTMTGPSHEKKYGLEREEASAAYWRGVGVHPYENRALRPGDEGYEEAAANGNATAVPPIETADADDSGKRTTAASRASSK